MNKKIIFSIICILILMVVGFGFGIYFNDENNEERDSKKYVQVSDNVRVSENIIRGFEDCDYIPRSISINKKMKQSGC